MTKKKIKEDRAKVIEVTDVVAHYGPRMVLNGVNVSVHEGEIMVVMGRSGSGKSTLLRHMLALELPTSGSVTLLNSDVSAIGAEALFDLRRDIGVAFQGGALLSSLTVEQNIMLPLTEHSKLDRQTMEIMTRMKLEVVGLSKFGHLMPSELSGGMLKRAALARAIVMDPKILFCDEPSSGLDPMTASALDDLIIKLRDVLGMSVVVITHEVESAFKIADRIAVVDDGEIVFIGTVSEVKKHKSTYIQNLLNRSAEDGEIHPEEYLRRLTGDGSVKDLNL
ncbi:MAG: ATP-binding cassette domain-containing protein [Rhodospirillaceae bacterium]|jgi:phospholipid/cholesterol/gamma-HCH transport system ATP-binding protein|nr:ATP-binding cassette domain-containing protein [Rhodospirillaceae bacterium]MBT7487690.1 ATP-binding cassette domain-containing protein [Rhodospirillales bacterium]MBT4700723.1 ATP-binding cassette domain-containing protein [Rhodospirillaceae bacterium]MBT5033606.1 ATP-binding cassette domain-containing protein [Rhodospirillaceae bacterium]MBT6220088.1 ATP-binding cassette domain-containing protein [Rhodospirillaceae bacterium]